jgi:NAD(P)-dependent dehydrogenase (short-subunit alcohol dehydrogenase family)
MNRSHRQQDLRVIISGAGAGIGFACASAFAARDAELILTDHDPIALTVASELLGAYSRFCDVVSDASIAILVAELEEQIDSFDVLINAAGNGYVRALGMVRMARALLPLMRKGSGARLIVNVVPCGSPRGGDRLFPRAGSPSGFRELHDAIAMLTRGSSIEVVAVRAKPRPTAAGSAVECGFDELAEEIVAIARAHRPQWVPRAQGSALRRA